MSQAETEKYEKEIVVGTWILHEGIMTFAHE